MSFSDFDKQTLTDLPLSRVLRLADYEAMPRAVAFVDRCQSAVIPPHPHQHVHRRWEQATAWSALSRWMFEKKITSYKGLKMSDWGCAVGMLPAMCVAAGADIDLVEPWQHGDESAFLHRQIEQVSSLSDTTKGSYKLWSHPCLCELDDKYWKQYDVSFCISTIEHIGDWPLAFRQLCQTVRPGGLIFLTMDFVDDNTIPHTHDCWRAHTFTKESMAKLGQIGSEHGFRYLGPTDWSWDESCRQVLDFSFGSIAMVKA